MRPLETYVDRTDDLVAAKATKEELWQAAKVGGLVADLERGEC